MTIEEAKKIYNVWRDYIEIADKLHSIFHIVPESFLPYPAEELEEALNIVAKDYFDAGDKKTARNIQEVMTAHLMPYHMTVINGELTSTNEKPTDEEVLGEMKEKLDLILSNPELKEAVLANLKRVRDSWLKQKTS